MSTEFYNDMAGLASELLTEFGQSIVVERPAVVTRDRVSGAETVVTAAQTQTVMAIVNPASKGAIEAFDQKLKDGTLIETNLRSITVPASQLEFEPAPNDKVTFGGEDWRVIGVTETAPGGIRLVKRFAVRR